jgi:N-acetylmuramoyl-L-alanine amidase
MNLMQNSNLEQSVRFAQLLEKHLKGGPIRNDRGLSQDPFLVLWRTAMPAVLLELGFISNADDLAVLKSAADRDKIAQRVFLAFKEYKEIYEGGTVTSASQPVPEESRQETTAPEEETVYAVQIFAVAKKLDPTAREFMGYTPRIVPGVKLYKYCIGVSDTADGARKHLAAIKKKYPDAFLVKIKGSEVTRIN